MPEKNMKQDSKAQIEDLVALVGVYLIVVYTVIRTKGLDERKTTYSGGGPKPVESAPISSASSDCSRSSSSVGGR